LRIRGVALKFGDNVDTDVILPGKYLVLTDPKELAKHAMEGLDKDFPKKASRGVILVAGENFGCGSSREHAPIALKNAGVKGVIAKSFARIFYRNSINVGLPVVESSEAVDSISENDQVLIDLESGEILNETRSLKFRFEPIPSFLLSILAHGGLINQLRQSLGEQR